jgi:hypothetical protein
MSRDLSEYTPEEFVRIYKSIKKHIANIPQEKNAQIKTVSKPYLNKQRELQAKIDENSKLFFVKSVGDTTLYIDRIECRNAVIRFDEHYTITPFTEKKPVIVGYYKNGNTRTRMEYFSYLRFESNGSFIAIHVGRTLTEAKQFQKQLEAQIKQNQPLAKRLNAENARYRAEINKNQAALEAETAKTQDAYQEKEQRLKQSRQKLLTEGTTAQIKQLYLPSRTVLAVIASFLALIFTVSSLRGYVAFFSTLIQRHSNYSIATEDSYDFDCNLKFSESQHVFYCSPQQYNGKINKANRVTLIAGNSEIETTSDGNFTRQIPLQIFTPEEWATENISFKGLAESHSQSTDTLTVYQKNLHSYVAQKTVTIRWNFSDNDKAFMKEKWSQWRLEQEQLAREKLAKEQAEEAERQAKAAEEARLKAEEEAKKQAEEASTKAAEEAQRLQEQQKQQRQQQKSQTQTPSITTPQTQNNAQQQQPQAQTQQPQTQQQAPQYDTSNLTLPIWISNTEADGYCKDGMKVHGNPHLRGRANQCWGHGGWYK